MPTSSIANTSPSGRGVKGGRLSKAEVSRLRRDLSGKRRHAHSRESLVWRGIKIGGHAGMEDCEAASGDRIITQLRPRPASTLRQSRRPRRCHASNHRSRSRCRCRRLSLTDIAYPHATQNDVIVRVHAQGSPPASWSGRRHGPTALGTTGRRACWPRAVGSSMSGTEPPTQDRRSLRDVRRTPALRVPPPTGAPPARQSRITKRIASEGCFVFGTPPSSCASRPAWAASSIVVIRPHRAIG